MGRRKRRRAKKESSPSPDIEKQGLPDVVPVVTISEDETSEEGKPSLVDEDVVNAKKRKFTLIRNESCTPGEDVNVVPVVTISEDEDSEEGKPSLVDDVIRNAKKRNFTFIRNESKSKRNCLRNSS